MCVSHLAGRFMRINVPGRRMGSQGGCSRQRFERIRRALRGSVMPPNGGGSDCRHWYGVPVTARLHSAPRARMRGFARINFRGSWRRPTTRLRLEVGNVLASHRAAHDGGSGTTMTAMFGSLSRLAKPHTLPGVYAHKPASVLAVNGRFPARYINRPSRTALRSPGGHARRLRVTQWLG